jgi:oxygen-dependent protoporphyrinogen oxidase
MPQVAIIGAGISGLAAAHALARAGCDVQVFERGTAIGGRMHSERVGGFLMEHGPNCLVAPAPAAERLIGQAGLSGERIDRGERVRRRYLVRDGRVHGLSIAPHGLFTSSYLSPLARLRLLLEPFAPVVEADESIADFVRRRFGREFLDYLIDPLVGGLYAGDPERLSVAAVLPQLKGLERRYGSVLRGVLQARLRRGHANPAHPANRMLFSFRQGLGALPRQLATGLPGRVHLGERVSALQPIPGGGFLVRFKNGEETRSIRAEQVIVATSAPVAAGLIEGLAPDVAEGVGAIAHPPLAVVFLGYSNRAVAHPLDGLGVLTPTKEKRPVLGMLFNSTLFAGRAPEGCVALTAFVGGARDPELAKLGASELAETVHREAAELLGIDAPPLLARVRYWRTGLPQPAPGHEQLAERVLGLEAAYPGLHFTGNWLAGVSVANCIDNATAVAGRAAAGLAIGAARAISYT